MDQAPTVPTRSGGLDGFLAASPAPQRLGLRTLLAVGRRPRGAALLVRAPALAQVSRSMLAMERYDEPALARALGFDAEAVAARGLALRRAEGRP